MASRLFNMAVAATAAGLLLVPLGSGAQAATPTGGDPAPHLSFDSTDYTVDEGNGSATFTVQRTGDSSTPVTVQYATSDGTASAGSDYTDTSGTLSFAAGQTAGTVTVPVADDCVVEGNEAFKLTLTSPDGAVLETPTDATMTILDNDTDSPAEVAFDQSDETVAENAHAATLTVTRSGNTAVPASVDYARSGGSATAGTDFDMSDGTITFEAGETSKTIPVTIIDDGFAEGSEDFTVSLSAPCAGTVLGAQAITTVTIAASDQRPDAQVSTVSKSGYIGNDVYNTTGTGQTRTAKARQGQTRTFYVRVYNDGSVTNTISLAGGAASAGSTVAYYAGSTNVTSKMRGSNGWPVTLAPGAYKLVQVRVKVKGTAALGSRKSAAVRGVWRGDSTRTDLAKAVVKVVR